MIKNSVDTFAATHYKPPPMANTSSAKKKIRVIARKTDVNRVRRSRIRTFIKKVDVAIEGGDKKVADAALRKAESEMARGVSRGIIKKETMSRKISRLSARVKALAGTTKKAA